METIGNDDKNVEMSTVVGKFESVWFVLCVRVGSEDKVLRVLRKTLDSKICMPFIPAKILPLRGERARQTGKWSKKEHCFPGYVFFRVNKDKTLEDGFFDDFVHRATSVDGAFYFLYYDGNKQDIEMREHERVLLERLMNEEFCVAASIGVKEGDSVRITSGALVGFESIIKKINKHKKTCKCVIDFMGSGRETVLSLDIVEKVSE